MQYISVKNAFFNSKHLLKSFKTKRFLATHEVAVKKKVVSCSTLLPKYDPKDVECQWYEWWMSQNYFKGSKSEEDSFIILLPPPNVTGTLHLGHVLTATIQDVILRWKRMKGESVLWIPGIDHAGIATQVTVERYLSQTLGVTRYSLGRDEFQKKILEWKEEKENMIIQQLKCIGASLDWTKFTFTMDPAHSEFVNNTFIKLFNDGLIYRKKNLINWSCALKSSISDIEVDWIEIEKKTRINVPGYEKPVNFGLLYNFAYKVCDEDAEIIVSTSRPETMLGDVAVAVHPDNPSHSKFAGKLLWHPFRNEKIPVILDKSVDMNLGTGAVKITPSHSTVDFQIGLEHKLPMIEVINEDGRLHNVIEKFNGLKRFDARNVVINQLKNLGLFRGYAEYSTRIPVCSRSGDVIEYLLKDQWFLNCQKMSSEADKAVENGALRLIPEKFNSVWKNWLENCRDWNLSRQLWWGHQIPMYECKYKDTIWVPALNLKEAKEKASKQFGTSPENITAVRDPDVLDTWFSSALLPLSAVPDREKSPISLMVTGHDILFFWVARMVMLTQQLTGKLPFQEVILHGLMCDSKGRKMSKSLGNVIQPEDIIQGRTVVQLKQDLDEKLKMGLLSVKDHKNAVQAQEKMFPKGIPECGVDGLRLTLCCHNVLNQFINFDVELCESNRHFCNKIWQATKYFIKIFENYNELIGEQKLGFRINQKDLNSFDKWILSRLSSTIKIVDESIGNYNFNVATNAIKFFFVEEFCNVYLESTKIILKEGSLQEHNSTILIFYNCLETSLRLLCPFMPFVCEHLYQALPVPKGFSKNESITTSEFPKAKEWESYQDCDLDNQFETILKVISAFRSVKITLNLLKIKPKAHIQCPEILANVLFSGMMPVISSLSGVENITRVSNFNQRNIISRRVNEDCIVYVEHEYDKNLLTKLAEPTMKKEGKLKENLNSLLKITTEPKWNELTPHEKHVHQKKIKQVQNDLSKIEDFKKVILNCDR